MAITSLDDYIGATKQIARWSRIGGRSVVGYQWFTLLDIAGSPGAGVLAGTSAAAGVVPTSADAGFPRIYPYGSGKLGYLTRLWYTNGWGGVRMRLYDLLWKGGTYAYNANVDLADQPSFASRLPLDGSGDPMYAGLEIWAETVTAFTGYQTFNVTYTNQDGTGSRTTGVTGIGSNAPTLGRMWQLPLQSGDSGVQKVSKVVGATGTAGTANILIMRFITEVRSHAPGYADSKGLDDMGFTPLPADTAIYPIISSDNTVSGQSDIYFEIASN